jgi:hypothetical protein
MPGILQSSKSFYSAGSKYTRYTRPVPVAARSKVWICGRSLAGIVGSDPAGGMDISLLRVLYCHVQVYASG